MSNLFTKQEGSMNKLIAILLFAFALSACAHTNENGTDEEQGGGERVEGALLIDSGLGHFA